MPMIPKHDYSVSELDEQKLYAITYCYMPSMGAQADEWCADTWNISGCTSIGEALDKVNLWCEGCMESGSWSAYEITNINIIRR